MTKLQYKSCSHHPSCCLPRVPEHPCNIEDPLARLLSPIVTSFGFSKSYRGPRIHSAPPNSGLHLINRRYAPELLPYTIITMRCHPRVRLVSSRVRQSFVRQKIAKIFWDFLSMIFALKLYFRKFYFLLTKCSSFF